LCHDTAIESGGVPLNQMHEAVVPFCHHYIKRFLLIPLVEVVVSSWYRG